MDVEFESSENLGDAGTFKEKIVLALAELRRADQDLDLAEVPAISFAEKTANKISRRLYQGKPLFYHALTDIFKMPGRLWRRTYRWSRIRLVTHQGRIVAFSANGRVEVCLLESDHKARELCHVFAIQGVSTVPTTASACRSSRTSTECGG